MLYGQDRDAMRRFYVETWRRYKDGQVLEPLAAMVAEVIALHPEYYPLLEDEERSLSRDYLPENGETNPFLHMGMHIAVREQLATDRPPGITGIYQAMLGKLKDPHKSEHRMLECLGQALWAAQRSGTAPDEQAYLECLRHQI